MNSSTAFMPTPAVLPLAWRNPAPALFMLLTWVLILYRETAGSMVAIWSRSETFTHGFLVVPIVLWLIWQKREALLAQTPVPTLQAGFAILPVGFLWLLGQLAAINVLTQLAFVALLVLSVVAVVGHSVIRLIIFPLAFLFFGVPMGEFLLPQFMEWTAYFTVSALRLSGIPVYREGLNFVIPSGNWSVVEACSGVRYLIASLTVGALFAYLNYQSTKRRLLFVLVSLLVPIVANWVRAYMIVMLGHLSNNKLAAGVDHLIYGWVFFGIVIMLMFYIGTRWSEPAKLDDSTQGLNDIAHAAPAGAAKIWITAALCGLLIAAPKLILWSVEDSESSTSVKFNADQNLTSDWLVSDVAGPKFEPAFQNPSAEENVRYVRQGDVVGVYLGYYARQGEDRKLISSESVLAGARNPRWTPIASMTRPVNIAGQWTEIQATELRRNDAGHSNDPSSVPRLLVWKVYWADGRLTSSDLWAKAYGALNRLLGRGDKSAAIVLYTAKEQGRDADSVLESFLQSNYRFIHARLLNVQP